MSEAKRGAEYIQQEKARIRRRYQGIAPENIQVIPVTAPEPDFDDDSEPKRVAVYVRVSTADPRQTSSYELQKNYYESHVQNHPNWTLYRIYADEGLSGTSTQKRKEFNRMIEDCKAGKIDLILTKNISRFARNYVDCGQIIRELTALNPPVGVRFESENLFTLKMEGEMQLMMFSGIAQEESRIKSSAMNTSIEMRFRGGIFLTPPLLGYDRDEEGNLAVNEREAKIVQLIFFLYLYGCTCRQIADTLTQAGCPTKKGNTVWSAGSVLQVLRNERHCGAVRARKTFTPNYLNHKARKNRGERPGYFVEKHHDPIVSPEDYFAAQKLISSAKYGGRGILPELRAVSEGLLKGFVTVNLRWAGFGAEEYREASLRFYEPSAGPGQAKAEVHPGDFDLRGFETARPQFFQILGAPYVTISEKGIRFNRVCIQKLNAARYVELLLHPGKKLLAVRPAEEKMRYSVCWTGLSKDGECLPRTIGGAAFIPTLYRLFSWNMEYRYCIRGVCHRKEDGAVLLFPVEDAEILIPDKLLGGTGHRLFRNAARRAAAAFPELWADTIGEGYYTSVRPREPAVMDADKEWRIMASAVPPSGGGERDFTASDSIAGSIRNLLSEVWREGRTDGG